jgi:hypothetical protein
MVQRWQEWRSLAEIVTGSALGIVVLVMLAAGHKDDASFWHTLGVLTVLAAAAFATGGLVGFVFGIPRIPSSNGVPDDKTAESGSSAPNGSGSVLHNSNLVQVSDWLTKILLGAGLTQMGQIGTTLGTIARRITYDTGVAEASIASLIVCFALLGFLSFYIWTITSFTGAISRWLRQPVASFWAAQRA